MAARYKTPTADAISDAILARLTTQPQALTDIAAVLRRTNPNAGFHTVHFSRYVAVCAKLVKAGKAVETYCVYNGDMYALPS